MKRHSFTYVFITVLLLLATVFSAFTVFIGHSDACEHETVCEYCEEIAVTENAVQLALEAHESCAEHNCQTCVLLAKQIERIEEQKSAEHTCREVLCEMCLREAVNRRLRVIFYTLLAFAVLYALARATHWIKLEETLFEIAFTLSRLKVRLNN